MIKNHYKKKVIAVVAFFIIIQFFHIIQYAYSDDKEPDSGFQNKNPKGKSFKDKIKAGQTVSYQFSNNKKISFNSNVEMEFTIEYDDAVKNKEISLQIENDEPLSLNINSKSNYSKFSTNTSPKTPDNINNEWVYGCVYQFKSNSSIEKLTLSFNKSLNYGLNPENDYSIAIYGPGYENWQLLSTDEISYESNFLGSLSASDANPSEEFLESTLLNLEEDEVYYVTIFELKEPKIDILDHLWWILIIIVGILSLVIIVSKKDYIRMVRARFTPVEKGAHRLSLEEVLENENRNKIIEIILNRPGIHFNELMREIDLAPGNLVWHLDILKTYKIIGKKRIGNFLAYFPYYQKNPISNVDLKLEKSKLTLEILEMIEEQPGVWNSLITQKMKVDHKTIHYHIKKLIELGLISARKEGRKKKLYPNLEADYYKNNENKNDLF